MTTIKKTKSKFEHAPELTFDDYVGALPEGNKIVRLTGKDYPSILTNCPIHDDRTPSLLMSWIPTWKFKSLYMCAFHCFAGCPRKDLVSYFKMRLAHKLEAIDEYWKEKKKEKKERERKQKQAHRNVDEWLTNRGL